ncbi:MULTISPECIES: NADH-quinone oxidoreductase subunit NuoN [Aneurinibacillus]|uniref:NADH-quinone oxidoreductase subunit N n=1 Tax=Aneurinibacillus thermoaerophilus TaxID=143495 RepID=A0A1G8A018_ANETH|nr:MULTISPECIES: NADH-quinone oxidoreductase subunit NuoN [Aneurinibacillus]AMA71654.1 NADH:ubiquinone oxidoreductase subunit N [Aneurinibacillus sp. XH2]MED0676102.1 NADH-quinone oxidoreductase subunit NuoN [Aneurinibacillus thermoaerophilus]MED0680798.1 NADH-quinone oxidoreductase subunit NuoN [Aneurinibacillus thermoaerophilus]MED0738367.1 NADH-quinone oxidoreductase subunit NuoN [Aneurinibacillus thermoaerophilus]MED0763880.1 NADH-quinone oxidoreductase subunit NuoN [Aneurinibacillus therm
MSSVSKWGNLAQYDWSVMSPEFIILGVATLLSLLDLFMNKKADRRILAWIGFLGIIVAGYFVVRNTGQNVVSILNDMYRVDGFANAFKLLFLSGVAFVFLISLTYIDESKNIRYSGEYYYLILTALLGAMLMASSSDLITLFVGLELLSISSYILVGTRKQHIHSNESAFKYVISGGIASAITLYGMSFIYGLTGSTNLYVIAERLSSVFYDGFDFLVYFSFFLMFVGFAFKISVVPYHMWAPDVYQGAPTPIAAFLSVVSKAAGFAIVLRVFLISFGSLVSFDMETGQQGSVLVNTLSVYIAIVAAASMIIGNTLAMRQVNIKRMMAYSGIAQAGYLLVPFATLTVLMFEQTMFYLVAYLFANMGAFAIIMLVNRDQKTEDLKSFAGLYHRAPWMAIAMTFFLLSLAGLPITAGFFGKFYIFMSAIVHSSYWLAGIMLATSVVSYYYYFGVIRQMYMRPGKTEAPLKVPASIGLVVLIALVGTVAAGIMPDPVMQYIHHKFPLQQMFQPGGQ